MYNIYINIIDTVKYIYVYLGWGGSASETAGYKNTLFCAFEKRIYVGRKMGRDVGTQNGSFCCCCILRSGSHVGAEE